MSRMKEKILSVLPADMCVGGQAMEGKGPGKGRKR
jgi:hypothetical protein